ncbi:MAG: bifunctional 3-phenylpropionate/cinnamic acid dioxygenase ferredoxin subunit [candidate division KSB1 bacterium]|nr:bifunctional 3-phenylpropionate/cinnamic acid dioxygenase ferredoxin subunit [candidate division KSB1 bacterium]MDQ7066041.1 bifunctional 3-phenylpropionate/cinnamic acid dioxygenase ferredoxin subunit [candidate division KSB1 bacterium]
MADFVEVAKTTDIPAGKAKVVEVQDKKIAIFHVDGRFYAIDDTCSHEDASLAAGTVEGTEVMCPLHGARFDLRTGKNLSLPAVFPVQSYELKIENDAIFILV